MTTLRNANTPVVMTIAWTINSKRTHYLLSHYLMSHYLLSRYLLSHFSAPYSKRYRKMFHCRSFETKQSKCRQNRCLKHLKERHKTVHAIIAIFNNYSPKWRWLAVDIYRAAKRRGKYPPLATDTEVNSCFSIY